MASLIIGMSIALATKPGESFDVTTSMQVSYIDSTDCTFLTRQSESLGSFYGVL